MSSIGTFLMADDNPVGILLTIAKKDAQTGRKVVNLSSWYVEEGHRWSAARLLMAALSDKEAIYTDLSPTKAAAEINARFGFRTFGFKRLLLVLPWLAVVGPRKGHLVALDAVPPGAIAEPLLRDLRRHRDLGCVVTVVEAGGRYHPVVLGMIRRRHVSAARVIFAESIEIVTDNLGALARLLLLRGVPLLVLEVEEDRSVPHAWVWKRGLCHQVKGDWDDSLINELYSERVLLNV